MTEPERATPPSGWYEFPTSYAQRRLWFLHQLEPQSTAYNVPWFLRLTGDLDRGALERSLRELVRRHESLRTTFLMRDGEPVQQIYPPEATGEFTLPLADLSQLGWRERGEVARALRQRESTCPFDLGRGPLVRFSLVRLADREHELLGAMHHIVSDGWSKGVLMRELCALYEAFLQGKPSPLAEPTIQYADYSLWQRELVQNRVFERQLEYWLTRLADIPFLDLPTFYQRSQATSRPGAVVTFSVPRDVGERLQELKQSEVATSFIVLLAAFQWLLGLHASQEDVSAGTIIASRSRKGTENLVGLLLNTLVIRADLGGEPSFRELIGRVRQTVLEAYANQDAPFDQIMEGLRPQRILGQDPLLQAVFIVESGQNEPSNTSGLRIEEISAELDHAKFEVLLSLQETPEGLQGGLQYAADLYDRQSMEQMARQYRRLIEIASAEPDTPLTSLSLIEDEDWRIIQNRNQTEREYPSDRGLQELFERQVEADPQALALVQGSSRLTYRDLNRRANQLAHYLLSRGVGPEVPVALCLDRGVEMVVGMLAILKAGGAYVPLDPSYPADRLEYMIGDISARLVITEDAFLDRFREIDTDAVSIESLRDEIASLSVENPPRANAGDDLAYVIYTSGSTGVPKGIMVSHRAITRLVINTDYVEIRPGDRVAQVSNASFDAATFEIWGALLNGAALVVIDKDIALSPAELSRQLRRERVTAIFLTASLFNQTVQADRDAFQGLRYVLVGGEALDPRWVGEVLGGARPESLLNAYGPTETTTFATWFPVREVEPGCRTIPIGGPIANTRAYALDKYLRPTPPGLPGEIYIGGPGVARGYWGNPELTAGRFVPDPFSSQGGERLYRTGDRGRYRNDGAIEFLGRTDDQVKLRGYRIEIGEIEASLKRHEAVKDAVVVLREEEGEKRLVGYVVGKPGKSLMGNAVREWLKKRLPDYMAPSAIVILPELPLNANGKLDRRALPPPGREDRDLEEYVAPRTELEESLCRIWAETLRIDRVGITDNFFGLGGHSLLATRVISKTNDLLKLEIPLRTIFESPTVAEFAMEVDACLRGGSSRASSIKRASRDGALPLSPAQQRLWFLNQLQPESGVYNVPVFLRLTGDLDRVALERGLSEIARRHEVLRTDFPTHEGELAQRIRPARPITIPLADLSALAPGQRERAAQELRREEANRPFDLGRGPLLRALLLRLREQDHELLLTIHHIVTDGWSQGILVNELRAIYEAYRAGGDSPLPELEIQYVDYAAWQRDWLQSEELLRQIAYWRKRLDGVPVLEMPADYSREQLAVHPQGSRPVHLSSKLAEDLKQLSRREGATLFMGLMAGFQWLLSRYARQKDVAVGTEVANRNRLELENLIGFFVNTLVFRVDASGAPTFREFLRREREMALQAYAHQALPFERLVEELNPDRDLGRTPFFQAFMTLQNLPVDSWDLPGLRVEGVNAELQEAKFDLTLVLIEGESGIEGQLGYAADLFAPESIDQIIRHYANLLEQAVARPDVPLTTIELLSPDERRQIVVEWNRATRTYPGELAPEAFEIEARRAPKATALEFQGVRLTYQELDERSNRLARYLLERGLVREMCVGIGLERGIDWAVAILAVWKAGGVYLPLDITHPKDRLAFMLEEAKVGLVLSELGMLDDLPPHPFVTCLDEDWELIEQQSAERPAVDLWPEQLAYVMYTSGSTGKPKGVMIEHRGMLNHLWVKAEDLGLRPEDVVAQNASASFDISVWQLFSPLIVGAKAQIIGEEISRSPFELFEEVDNLEITVLETVPTMLGAYLGDPGDWEFKRLRCLISNAEPLPVGMCERWMSLYPGISLINTFGTTESSDDVTHQVVELSGKRNLTYATLGTPLPNLTVYVLDEEMQPAPYGVAGELYLGGLGVGRGYLGRPALTAMRFVPDPFSPEPGRRLYRTGDLGRLNRDGSLEFLGRMDFQVKLLGHRVELGEIEARLMEHAKVREAVVVAREDAGGDKRLVAYVVSRDEEAEANDQETRRAVSGWQSVFEQVYGRKEAAMEDELINPQVWISSYTGEPFREEEILECVENTVGRILDLKPKRVLEIGCGTGLILARVAPSCEEYYGTDISGEALGQLRRYVERAGLGDRVKLLERAADDLGRAPRGHFDVVVLNEVVQYFPNLEYLLRVLDEVRGALAKGGSVYLGDIRNLDLLETFHTSVELYQADMEVSAEELRRRIRRRLRAEKELALAPGLFMAMRQEGGWVKEVAIELKWGSYGNELAKFRYDVTLHTTGRMKEDEGGWQEWEAGGWSLERLRAELSAGRAELAFAGVPNARVRGDLAAQDWLEVAANDSLVREAHAKLAEVEKEGSGVDPEELRVIGREFGYEAQVSWPSAGLPGSYKVLLRRAVEQPAAELLEEEGERNGGTLRERRPGWSRFANRPLAGWENGGLAAELMEYLQERLPGYMVPAAYVELERLPLTVNGKIDRKALPAPEGEVYGTRGYEEPQGEIEAALAGIWAEVLKLERVGRHDNFFALGGHSLLATQVISRTRDHFRVEVPLAAVFRSPTVAAFTLELERTRGARPIVAANRANFRSTL